MPAKPSPTSKYADFPLWLYDTKGRGLGLRLVNNKGEASVMNASRKSYPRSTLKVNSGSGAWTDLQPPYGQFSKTVFTGGLGLKDIEADQTRYWFASGVWTCGAGGIMLAPQWYHADTAWPVKYEHRLLPTDSPTWTKLDGTYIAVQITIGGSSATVAGVRLPIRSSGTPGNMTVTIYTNSAAGGDHPDALVTGASLTTSTHLLSSSERNFTFPNTVTLSASTKYWIRLTMVNGVTDHDITEYLALANASYPASTSSNGTDWSSGATPFIFSLMTSTDISDAKFFVYRNGTFCWMTDSDSSGTVHLFVNGDMGLADSNSADKTYLYDSTKSGTWVPDAFIGAMVRIIAGPGKGEWRKITDNDATSLTVDRDWTVTHNADSTVYVIYGGHTWTELTSHGLSWVTDAVAGENNNVVYFARDSETATNYIRRMRGYIHTTPSNHWDWEYADDGTNTGDLVISSYDQEHTNVIWTARNNSSNNEIAMAPQVAWGTNLTFETAIKLGSKEQDITGILQWGNKIGIVCMDRIWGVLNGVPDMISRWSTTWDRNTGRRPVLMSGYLVFPDGNNLMRLVGDLIEDFGPEVADGLPKRYSGQWIDLFSEKGILLAAKKSGSVMRRSYEPNGESGVYLYHSGGWHPICHLDSGTSLHAITRQRRDNKLDVLWMATRDTLYYCYFPRSYDYRQDMAFWGDPHLVRDGVVLLGKVTAGSETLDKWWSSINLYGVDLHTSYTDVEVYYRTTEPVPTAANGYAENVSSDWTYLGNASSGTFSKIVCQVKSKQLWLLLRLEGDGTHTPVVQAVTIDYMARVDSADIYPISFRLDDVAYMENGMRIPTNAEQARNLLDEWARDILPLTTSSTLSLLDGHSVIIERPNYQPLPNIDPTAPTSTGREAYFGSMVMMESGVELYRRPLGSGVMIRSIEIG